MKKIHYLKTKKQKTILSLVLALIMTFSFNYAPLSVFVNKMSNERASAYTSTTTKNYYGENLVTKESGISSADLLDGTSKYFDGSTNNYNIYTEYTKKFNELFAKYADEYLANQTMTYDGHAYNYYSSDPERHTYLSAINATSLSAYFDENKSGTLASYANDFRAYFEYFVTTEFTYNVEGEEEPRVLYPLFDANNKIFIFNQSQIYNGFANYVESVKSETVVSNNIEGEDGLSATSNFYTDSISYNRLKKLIDDDIAEEMPIYAFDGVTQDDYSAAIIANYAPKTQSYYYKDNSYEAETVLTLEYIMSGTNKQVYYFGTESDVLSLNSYNILKNSGAITVLQVSEFESSTMLYRLIESGEYGYLDESHPTFYKYSRNPYEKENEIYKVYVVEDTNELTDSRRATYASLYYVNILTQDEFDDAQDGLYVKVPYFYGNTNYADVYFKTIFGYSTAASFSITDYNNLVDLFLENDYEGETLVGRESRIYLKVNSTSSNRLVYAKNLNSFNENLAGSSYSYSVYEIPEDANIEEEYVKVTTADGFYYTEKYSELYFKRVKTYYYETETVYGEPYSSPSPAYSFEKNEDGSKKLYVVTNNVSDLNNAVYANLGYTRVSTEDYDATYFNYVKVESTDANYSANFNLYYKLDITSETISNYISNGELFVQNEITGGNAVYIVDDSLTSSDKSIYRSLFYNTIDSVELKNNAKFYVKISDQKDANNNYLDSNYSKVYTSLYYKYASDHTPTKDVYLYTTSSSTTSTLYKTFLSTDSDYDANRYVKIDANDPNYVVGADLYYKLQEVKTESTPVTKNLYYYYQTSAALELKSNSYYAVSFYVYTNGNAQASFYLKDSNKAISDVKLENITTDEKWVKYTMFVATNSLTASNVLMYFYLGNEETILGNCADETAVGMVLFDNILVTLINATDFEFKTIDGNKVNECVINLGEENEETLLNKDKYQNDSYVLTFDNRSKNNQVIAGWDEYFNFDSYTADDNHADLNNLVVADKTTHYNADTENWHYYISRDISSQGSTEELKKVRDIYSNTNTENGKLNVSLVSEADIDKNPASEETAEEAETETEATEAETTTTTNDEEESSEVMTVASTFNADNKVLKIENKTKTRKLGIASKNFTIKQGEYYKVVVWIYSPDKESKATIKLESVLMTGDKEEIGTLLSASFASVNACLEAYSTAPTNEYSWIPYYFYIEGNVYHNQDVSLVLLADENSTVYFDNITVEKVNSTVYTAVSSDSDDRTTILALSTSTSKMATNITNGYFDTATQITGADYSTPKTASNWTTLTSNSKEVVAGVIGTSDDYKLVDENNFYKVYNNGKELEVNGFANNVLAIYAPSEVESTITGATSADKFASLNNYKVYSSSFSITAATLFEVSFEFATGYYFEGTMVASLYANGAPTDSTAIKVATFELDFTNESGNNSAWSKYTFFVYGGDAATTVYLEIGVENAKGVAFFQKVNSVESKRAKNINEISDLLATTEVSEENEKMYYGVPSIYRLVDFTGTTFNLTDADENLSGIYENQNYTNTNQNTLNYTTGEVATVVSSYYTTSKSSTYSVEIKDYNFIKDSGEGENHNYTIEEDEDDKFFVKAVTNEETGAVDYKLYSDSTCTVPVVGFDVNKNGKVDDDDLNNYLTYLSGTTVKVKIDEDELTVTESVKTNYNYTFTNDVTINGNVIEAEKLNNNHSKSVLVISNKFTTDYTIATPNLKNSLASNSYYVLRVYAKVGTFEKFKEDAETGFGISIDSLTVTWKNITENNESNLDENGFVCYETWITTNSSTFNDIKVKFTLGTEDETCSAYAIIAGVEIEKFESKTVFEEYTASKEELYNADENNSIAKRYYGTESSSNNSNTDTDSSSSKSTTNIWITFFYIFSSLLLGIVIIMALVSAIIKKHPIKRSVKVRNEDETFVVPTKETTKEEKAKKKADKKAAEDGFTDEKTEEPAETEAAEAVTETAENAEENTEVSAEEKPAEETEKPEEKTDEPASDADKTDETEGF